MNCGQFAIAFGSAGLIGGIVFLIIAAAVAFIAFRLLKRTVKMAFRIAVLMVLLAIGVVGCIAFWSLGTGSSTAKPASTRAR